MTAQEARELMPIKLNSYEGIIKIIKQHALSNCDFHYTQMSFETLSKLRLDGYKVEFSEPNKEYRISW